MANVIVIGGGASGLVSAIVASRCGNNVKILEKRSTCGKKILVTGNGRCNYYNDNQDNSNFYSSDKDTLSLILTMDRKKEVLEFFNKLGIVPFVKNGYYYPYSKDASTIRNLLLMECKKSNVEIENEVEVIDVVKNSSGFTVMSNDKNYFCDKVIFATGSLAYYKDDTQMTGYNILEKFGHNIMPILPSLVQLKTDGTFLRDWMGVRCDASVSIFSNDELSMRESGEILLTDYGVSGICIFNISGIASRNMANNVSTNLKINFVPWFKENNFMEYLDERCKSVEEFKIDRFLEGFLNYKLVNVILKCSGISKDTYYSKLNTTLKMKLVSNITEFSLNVTGTYGFDRAQVCTGGVKLSEVNKDTMESLKEKGIFITGEVLDVDGKCGGYNLEFAFLTGMLAGSNVGK